MPFVDYYVGYFFRILSYSTQCAALPMHTAQCGKFWGVLYLSAAFVCFLVFMRILRKIIQDYRDFKAYLKRKEERAKVAEPEVMAKYRWNGD